MTNVQVCVDERGVAIVTLTRADKHNALNADVVRELHGAISNVSTASAVRVVVLTGAGASFCAGADIAHMRSMLTADEAANAADAMALAECFRAIDECPKPVIARIQGNAFGGGLGLIAAVDIAIASQQAKFALTEVRLGIIPATISPFVVRAIGSRQARRLFLTAEMFAAEEAKQIGLVHHVCSAESLDAEVSKRVDWLLRGGPQALAAAKELVRSVDGVGNAEALSQRTAAQLAALRVSAEGQEGLGAFLEKRSPTWMPDA